MLQLVSGDNKGRNKGPEKMKVLRKCIVLFCCMVLCVVMAGCGSAEKKENKSNPDQLTVMTTLFPYYDFVRAVVGEEKEVHVELLMSPGQDSHSFEPTPSDIVKMDEADVFIYNGGSIENWVEEVMDSLENKSQIRMRMMDYVKVLAEDHENLDEIYGAGHDHEHEEEEHQDNGYEGQEAYVHEEADEHIWTSPAYAMTLVQKICDTLCKVMPEKENIFRENAENYVNQIKKVDNQFTNIVNHSQKKEIIFADKFPLKYFAQEYGLNYYAAFLGCSGDTEPSAKTVAFLIDKIKERGINGVFYLELSSQAMADVICDDTDVKKYQFHSCHNITQEQFDSGVTYVDLMWENAEALAEVFNETEK